MPGKRTIRGVCFASPFPVGSRNFIADKLIVGNTTNVNNCVKDSERLKEFREGMGLTQAQMSVLLGLNRSYLAELESGRRPIQDWIIQKAKDVSWRLRDVSFSREPVGMPEFEGFEKSVASLSNDELTEILDHFATVSQACPHAVRLIYEVAGKIVLDEVKRRMK